MALANFFYHASTRRYIALFGSIFNKLTIERRDGAGQVVQKQIVPVAYGPYQKFLSRIQQDPNLDHKAAVTLPRIAFEVVAIDYDGERKLPVTNRIRTTGGNDGNSAGFAFTPTPYNIQFNAYIMSKNAEDITQIVEQIIPFFSPEWTPTVKLIDNIEPFDIPIVYHGLSIEDVYDGAYEQRRSLVWTLSFTMKGWYFKPLRRASVIKFIDVRVGDAERFTEGVKVDRITLQPGLDEDGNPTTDPNNSIPYIDIEEDDDWALIQAIEEYEIDE